MRPGRQASPVNSNHLCSNAEASTNDLVAGTTRTSRPYCSRSIDVQHNGTTLYPLRIGPTSFDAAHNRHRVNLSALRSIQSFRVLPRFRLAPTSTVRERTVPPFRNDISTKSRWAEGKETVGANAASPPPHLSTAQIEMKGEPSVGKLVSDFSQQITGRKIESRRDSKIDLF